MKTIALLLLFTGLGAFGQTIQKKDGSTIDLSGGKIHVEAGNKRLTYFLKDSKDEQHIKFKDLKQATWDDFVFRTLEVDGKSDGYYVIGEQEGKTLVANKRIRIKSRGGFESTYTLYEVAVLDAQNKTLEELSFTDVSTDKKSAERGKMIPMVRTHFANCTKLIERVSAFESPSSDTKNNTILVFLNDPVYIKCE